MEYPSDECKETDPVPGYLAVIVDADGEIQQGPDVIGSTGYYPLDDEAKEKLVETRDLRPREKSRLTG